MRLKIVFLIFFLLVPLLKNFFAFGRDQAQNVDSFILITSLYNEKNQARIDEYLTCLKKNKEHPLIKEIHVLYDTSRDDEGNSIYKYLIHNGMRVTTVVGRPSFQICFDIANSYYAGSKIIIANADIYFNETLSLLKNYNLSGLFLALTRWDMQKDGAITLHYNTQGGPSIHSQDVWIFHAPIKKFNNPDIFIGTQHCDGKIAYQAKQAGLVVINPCLSIQSCHLHLSDIRHYPPLINPKEAIPVYWTELPPQKRNYKNRDISFAYNLQPFVTQNAFVHIADFTVLKPKLEFDPQNVTPGAIIYVKTDYLDFFFKQVHPRIKSPYILVTGCSTYSVPGKFAPYLKDQQLAAWFGKNATKDHPKMHCIPVGISDYRTNIHCLTDFLSKVSLKKDKLLYMNFVVSHNPEKRRPVWNLFFDKSFCYKVNPKDFCDYIMDLATSHFVLSPEGLGIDTYRTWESILLGAIPIVQRSPLDKLYQDLPIVIVDRWEDISEEFLYKKLEEMSYKTYTKEKLKFEYWLNLILKEKERILSDNK